jgi:hypothetical protein
MLGDFIQVVQYITERGVLKFSTIFMYWVLLLFVRFCYIYFKVLLLGDNIQGFLSMWRLLLSELSFYYQYIVLWFGWSIPTNTHGLCPKMVTTFWEVLETLEVSPNCSKEAIGGHVLSCLLPASPSLLPGCRKRERISSAMCRANSPWMEISETEYQNQIFPPLKCTLRYFSHSHSKIADA